MKNSLQSVLAIAAMLGIGGDLNESEPRESAKSEPVGTDERRERVERIRAKSRADQERKRRRRQAQFDKSEVNPTIR